MKRRFRVRSAIATTTLAMATVATALVIAAPAGAHTSSTFNGYCDTPSTNGCDDYLTRDEGIFNGVYGWGTMHPSYNGPLEYQYLSRINNTAIIMRIRPRTANTYWHRCTVDHDRGYGYAGVNVSCELIT
jgi:hypothetical protein